MRADARKNYDLLIDVAREVFVEQGAEASLRDIARRAGVGMGTLYRHFPNRDSLLEALLRSRFAALTARAESLLLAADPAAALLEWLAESVAFTHQHRGIIAPLMSAIDDPESALHSACVALRAAGTSLLTRAQQAGQARPGTARSQRRRTVRSDCRACLAAGAALPCPARRADFSGAGRRDPDCRLAAAGHRRDSTPGG